jgi:hypothetical protein
VFACVEGHTNECLIHQAVINNDACAESQTFFFAGDEEGAARGDKEAEEGELISDTNFQSNS